LNYKFNRFISLEVLHTITDEPKKLRTPKKAYIKKTENRRGEI